ncbi:NAD-dependent malic enzyme [Trueperella pyogenes]|uniref:NAD-dependent malic enzyme n=1 Tax=Trueperella pyogenes TaxID=1661 RepID=A0A3Q9GLH2_9ACTO|nr:NAD-dependent malic enzyme [Trueperella pyogenes]AZR07658.1 NAD-dependent malic enzyme [Trueperella pyogenes]MCI7690588.1 NAD-dependent malic enzyme [Trueperella pyogenes]QIU85982.1 NAD-dependent malic enzyme [Trueperella pyogenes]WHU61076.1 NAD-dependent malic enzyme [Trueperella pyogenes]
MAKPRPSYAVTLRIEVPYDDHAVPRITNEISYQDALITGIDMVHSDDEHLLFDVTCMTHDLDHAKKIRKKLQKISGVIVHGIHDATVQAHLGGKIEVTLKRPLKTRQDLSKIYTPGVAAICERIVEEPSEARRLTIKRNTVAVVTDGTAVLGLGDIGPLAAMPVMEGKAALFKNFAGVDAWPICLDTRDTEEIISIVKALAPGFAGINLEDISAPRCFEIERRLRNELDIPVFHDDQHGTAVVVLAALINALKVVNKKIEDVRIVVSGVGAAGNAIIRLLKSQGAYDIIGCGREGALGAFREEADPDRNWLALNTNPRAAEGDLKEVLKGADVFIGVSAGNLLVGTDIATMADDAIVFALANPTPEVDPGEAGKYAAIVATGRSDYPNQINNVLAFPGLFRGMLDVRASEVTDQMLVVTANAIADAVEPTELNNAFIIPGVFTPDLAEKVAAAIREEFSTNQG